MKRGPQQGQGMGVSLASATAAWGEDMPDWIGLLAELSDQTSQVQVGKEIGYSGSVISSVLKRSYSGDLGAVEKAARGRFMALTVTCPVLGEIAANVCLEHQKRAVRFSHASSHRVQIAKACRGGCPHSRIGRKA